MPNYLALKYEYGRDLAIVEKAFNKFVSFLKKYLPAIYALLTSPPNQYAGAKSIICFLIGTIYTVIIYNLTIAAIEEVNSVIRYTLGIFMLCLIAGGMALFVQIRCIVSLSVFNFVTSAGRLILIGYIIAHITLESGPVYVGLSNMKELTTSILCYHSFLANASANSFKIKWKPYKDIIVGIFTNNEQLVNSAKSMSNVINGADREIGQMKHFIMDDENNQPVKKMDDVDYDFKETVDEVNQAHRNNSGFNGSAFINNSLNNLDYIFRRTKELQCMGIMNYGIEICNKQVRKLKANCKDKLGLIYFLCEIPGGIGEFICSLPRRLSLAREGNSSTYCKEVAEREAAENMKEAGAALASLREAMAQTHNLTMTYLIPTLNNTKLLDITKLQTHITRLRVESKALEEDFKGLKYYFRLFYSIAKVISSYGFLLVFIHSFRYSQKYLNDISFDNCYISQYFRNIDARRFAAGKRTLLPIKKLEELTLVYPTERRILNKHNNAVKFELTLFGMLSSFTVFVIVANWFVADFNALIVKHGRIIHVQRGMHKILFHIKGKGFVANLLRKIIHDINIDEHVDQETDTADCFPKAFYLENKEIYLFAFYFTLLFVAIISELYFERFNRVICAFYYRKWEKQRVIWLYNKTLKNRRIYLKNLIKRAIMRSKGFEIEPDTSLLGIIVEYFTKKRIFLALVRILKIFNIGSAKCILCDQTERIGSVKCEICELLYCYECWMEVEKVCLVCTPSIYEQPDWRFEGDARFK